jgi:gliding motility-associated-like protein
LEGSVIGAPNYSFPIWWMNYQGWLDGVRDWEVERMDDGHPFSSIQAGYLNRSLVDKNLDYDWGGYWYRVKAKRNKPGDLTQTLSESNWIYLFQKPEVWVPTGITRNKDGLNDIWGTFPVFVREYSMLVYDRWGNILWESNQKKNQWDATVFGKDLPDGVYAWKVDFWGWDNKKYTKTGTVTVIH